MKFEANAEQVYRDEIKAKGGKLNFPDAYADFNEKHMNALLDKRRNENIELVRRQKERMEKLNRMKKAGALYIKE